MPSNKKISQLLQSCRERGLQLRTAESCTAGAVAAALASVAGASDVLDRGWVTYSNQAKMDELNVPEDVLSKHGAVSEAVVRAMAEGGVNLQYENSQGSNFRGICIAISGIAGPSGGSVDKPVGTVWMAVAGPNKVVQSEKFFFQGERASIQKQASNEAINLLLSFVIITY